MVNHTVSYCICDLKAYQINKMVKELTSSAKMLRSSFFSACIYKIPQISTKIYIRAPPASMYFTKEI